MTIAVTWVRVAASAANAGTGSVVAGVSQWGLPFSDLLAYSLNTDGQGGRARSPGMNACHFSWAPFGRAPDVELIENEFPLLIPISQHFTDSGGHGAQRGGCGTVQVWVAHQAEPVFFMCVADNSKIQTSQGLFGGYGPATLPGISIRHPDLLRRLREEPGAFDLDLETLLDESVVGGERTVEFMGRSVRPYDEGDVISFVFAGGGAGYGDPLDADPQSVLDGIGERSISDWAARTIYRIVYDPESGKVDEKETARLRDAERRARLERGRPWNEFVDEWSGRRPPEEILHWFGSWPEGRPLAPLIRH